MTTKYHDHLLDKPCTVTLRSGATVSGILWDETQDSVIIGLLGGRRRTLWRIDVRSIDALEAPQ